MLQTLLPYRLPRLKDSETSLPSLPNKVDIQIIGRKEEDINIGTRSNEDSCSFCIQIIDNRYLVSVIIIIIEYCFVTYL